MKKPIVDLSASEELAIMCGKKIQRWGGFNPKGRLLYVERTRRMVIAAFEDKHWAGYWRECYRRGCRIKRVTIVGGA